MSETWNLCRPGVPFEELAVEQPSFGPKSDLGATARVAQDPLGERKFATRIDDHTTRRNKDSLKTKAQSQSQSRIPAAAVLYSHRLVITLGRSALRLTARRFIAS